MKPIQNCRAYCLTYYNFENLHLGPVRKLLKNMKIKMQRLIWERFWIAKYLHLTVTNSLLDIILIGR